MRGNNVVSQLREQISRLQAGPRALLFSLRLDLPDVDLADVDELNHFRLGTGVVLTGDEIGRRAQRRRVRIGK